MATQTVRLTDVHEVRTLRASAALVGATGRENSTPVTGIEEYLIAIIHVDVTALTRPDADETLDVVVESSYDEGTTWLRIAQFTTFNTAGAQSASMVLHQSGTDGPNQNMDDTDPGSGTIRFGSWGDRMRVASTYTDPANADGTSTFSVKAFFKR